MKIALSDLPKDLQGNVVIDTKEMRLLCNSCGKGLGMIQYVPMSSKWDQIYSRMLCKNCWDKSGLEEVDWSKIPRPY